VYATTFASNFAARKGVMTADQYKSFHEETQKAMDAEEAKKNAERIERERLAKEKQEAERLVAATRKAAAPAVNVGAAPTAPKPSVSPYPLAPGDSADAVHLP
jgi:hypothetical protein